MSFAITKICRTCLALDGILLSIYDSKGSNGSGRIADMLRDIINMEAKKSDGMPEKVCLMCISEINRCYSFKMKCDNSDRTLRQLLNIPKESMLLALPKGKTDQPSKYTTESNSLLKDCDEEDKKLTKRKLAQENQNEDIKEECSSLVVARNIILSDQIEDEGSPFFTVHSEDNEVMEDENKNEENLDDDQHSGDYSIIFTKFVHETQDEAQMVDEEEDLQKNSHPIILDCSTKEAKLESKCSMCPMSFVHTRNLKKHMIKVHNARELTSTDISKEDNVVPFDDEELEFSPEELENREDEEYDLQLIEEIEESVVKQEPQPVSQNVETQVNELRCPRCRALFAMHSSLNIHIKLNKCTKPQFSCGDCKKVFISLISLKEHMKTHKFFCETCGENLQSKLELAKHLEEHRCVNPKHQCAYCKKVFTMRSTLNDHMRIHTGEKPFVCDLCGKAFSQNANLKQHVMRHNKTKPFKCDQCHQSFVSKGELYAHLRSHNGDQPFRCDKCPSAFTTSSSLVKHKRIHTGERPYSCDFCPMRFTALNTLKNHRRTHTGEKPYKCKFCPRAFAQKSDCSIHMRTHTGERRHSCNICNMKFQQSGTLRTHMKIHKEKIEPLQQEFEEHKEQQSLELKIIRTEDDQEILGEQHVETSETAADPEEGMEISGEELLHFNIEECASGNSVFSGE